jgi:ribosomal protein L25 (general stress protein Ctc)
MLDLRAILNIIQNRTDNLDEIDLVNSQKKTIKFLNKTSISLIISSLSIIIGSFSLVFNSPQELQLKIVLDCPVYEQDLSNIKNEKKEEITIPSLSNKYKEFSKYLKKEKEYKNIVEKENKTMLDSQQIVKPQEENKIPVIKYDTKKEPTIIKDVEEHAFELIKTKLSTVFSSTVIMFIISSSLLSLVLLILGIIALKLKRRIKLEYETNKRKFKIIFGDEV